MSMLGNVGAQRLLSFSYKDSKGNITERQLTHWKETSIHIQGRAEDETFYRTFRKDRVIEFFQGSQYLLLDKAPSAPIPTFKVKVEDRAEILFTGFKAADRLRLESLASDQGLRVVKTPTKALAFLCAGKTAGWTKVKAAAEKGAFILSESQLISVFETGEVSDSEQGFH